MLFNSRSKDWSRCLILLVTDIKICHVIRWWILCQIEPSTSSGSGSSYQQQAARKITVMCLTIATTFTITTVPYQLTQYILVYGKLEHALMVINPLRILSDVNSWCNPIIYAFMWRPFRQSLIQVGLRSCFNFSRWHRRWQWYFH